MLDQRINEALELIRNQQNFIERVGFASDPEEADRLGREAHQVITHLKTACTGEREEKQDMPGSRVEDHYAAA